MFIIKDLRITNSRTPTYHPLWATGYEGLEVMPNLETIELSLYNQTGYFCFVNQQWQQCDEPQFYPVAQMRSQLEYWYGEVGFIANISQGLVRLGANIAGDALSYILEFALKQYLNVEVDLVRWESVVNSSAALPSNLNPSRIGSCRLQLPNSSPIPTKVDGNQIFAQQLLPDGTARVILSYNPVVDYLDSRFIYQISELPCILIGLTERENSRYVGLTSELAVRTSRESKKALSVVQYDQGLDLSIISESNSDIRTIAAKLIEKIYLTSKIYLPPFDEHIFLQVLANVDYNPQLPKLKGNINAARIKTLIIGLLE